MAQNSTSQENKDMTEIEHRHLEEFVNSGRTGRRNAMADILDEEKASVGTGDLAFDMDKLKCCDSEGNKDTSQSQQPPGDSKGQGS